jgi:predicted Zn-dependent peptidase
MKFKKTVLSNGLRIITVPMPDNPAVTVLVMVEAGSKYETKEQGGLSHFIEHMLFKGTPRRPKATDISREFDGLGAQSNAFTSHEFTGYYAKADTKHGNAILDILSDMYLNPLLDENEMQKEKGVIIEEIRMYQDLPQARVQYLFMELMYGDQPVGRNVAGTEETVKSFTRKELADYRGAHYINQTTTIVVGGSFDEKEIIKKIETAFSALPSSSKKGKAPVSESQSAPAIATLYKESDQTHLVIGVRTFPIDDERDPILAVLSTILGKGMSSRLFAKMRDELGICYYIKTDPDSFTDHGLLSISAGVDNSRVGEGIKGILGECKRLKDELVPDAEMKKAKDYIAGTTMLELETSDARAEFCGYQEMLKGKIESPDAILNKINAVTAEDVQKLAREIFVDNSLNMAIVGRFKDGSAFKDYFKF